MNDVGNGDWAERQRRERWEGAGIGSLPASLAASPARSPIDFPASPLPALGQQPQRVGGTGREKEEGGAKGGWAQLHLPSLSSPLHIAIASTAGHMQSHFLKEVNGH